MTVQSLDKLHYKKHSFHMTEFYGKQTLKSLYLNSSKLRSKHVRYWKTNRIIQFIKLRKKITKLEREVKNAEIEKNYLLLVMCHVYGFFYDSEYKKILSFCRSQGLNWRN